MDESDVEEDDVEAQCRMIFEEFDPEMVTPASDSESTTNKDETHDPMAKYDDSGKRKRVAYENADSQQKPMRTTKPSTNHVQNAMQSVFRRQEIVRKQMEEKQQKEQEELAKRQEAERKAFELAQKAKSTTNNSTTKLTPSFPPTPLTNQRNYSKTFAPVSNVLAIQKAKEKVEQLRAAKQQQLPQFSKTIATTAPKGATRVAHAAPAPAAASVNNI